MRARLFTGRTRRAPDPNGPSSPSALATIVERRKSKCCASRKKLGVIGRDRVEERDDLDAAGVGLDVRRGSRENAGETTRAQTLLQTREHERALALQCSVMPLRS